MKVLHIAAAVSIAAFGAARLHAQTSAAQPPAQPPASAPSSSATAEGEVRKVDKEQGKVTLRHGPIQNLGMPAMTMVFKVADPKMLDGLKEGGKVRFSADRVDGAITITAIEPAR